MAEFWPENQAEPSSSKVAKLAGGEVSPAGSQPVANDPPTVLSSFKPASSLPADAPALVASELAGEMLAHYRLDDYVGVGGMGAVFRATDIRLDRPVALKILPPEQANDAEIVARFQHEARAAARLDHENIARVFFVGEERGLHFIAFEYVAGINVRDLIQQVGPLPAHEVVNYALQITGALIHACSRTVVHRDIKPSNIIITPTGRAKLVDMGLARNFERRPDGGLTQSGVTLGTFDYISPEQARDPRSADLRSDIYSLGCTLFHMLTGRPPFPEGTVLQKLLRHQEDAPPDPRQHTPNVPDEVAALVMRMMAKDPTRRFQSPQQLLTELLDIAAAMGLRSSSPEGLIWVSEPSRPSMTRTTLAVWLSAAATFVIAVWALYGRPTGSSTADTSRRSTPNANTSASIGVDAANSAVESVKGQSGPGAIDGETSKSVGAAGLFAPSVVTLPPTESETRGIESVPIESEVIAAGPRDDLRSVIEQAPWGAVIELSGEHRPQVSHRVDDTAGIRIVGKRLTIRAAPGARPRIMLSYDDQVVKVTDWNLFTLVGSHVEFEGIHFEIDAGSDIVPVMTGFSLESSQASLRRCSFFQVSGTPDRTVRPSESSVWVAHLDTGLGMNGQVVASRLAAHECFFGGGDGGFLMNGPAKLDLIESTLLAYRAPVRAKSDGFPQSSGAEFRLANVSWFGGGTPIFDLEFARAAVLCRDVVFSHAAQQGILARVDSESRLDWKGRRNLFHGLRHFLVNRSGHESVPAASRFREWRESTRDVDEKESLETSNSPWVITIAEAAGRSAPDAADAFRLARDDADPAWAPIGARFVLPWGPLYPVSSLDLPPLGRRPDEVSTNAGGDPASHAVGDATNVGGSRSGNATDASTNRLDMKKIMETMPTGDGTSAAAGIAAAADGTGETNSTLRSDAIVVDPQNAVAFHSLAAACSRAEDGAVIEIRHNGELRESPIELGDRHLTIRAAAGFRPLIQFVATPLELRGREPRLFDIRRGSLTLRDLDFQVVADAAISAETWSLVSARGADVSIERCTIAIATPAGLSSAAVRILTSDADDPMAAPMNEANPARPQVQVRNTLCAGTTNVVRFQSASRARVEIENCAIEVGENLLALAGGMERSLPGSLVELELRHSTIKSNYGLVKSEATEPRGVLPRLEIDAVDNVFVSADASAWLRFKSPRPASELLGLLRWKGMNNHFDGIELFWQIESTTSGDTEQFDWDKWSRFPDRSEVKDERGHVEFAESAAGGPASLRTRGHFTRLTPGAPISFASDGGSRGVDLSLIPATPHERDHKQE